MEGMSWRLLVLHFKGLLQLTNGGDVVRSKRLGSGASAGGRVAHLFVALFVGVVSRVSGLLAAFATVGAF